MIFMKKTDRKLTAGIGLALGITIFAGAALANYNTANGYDTFKTAAKGLLSNENYTMNAKIGFSIDGEEIGKSEFTELYDRSGDVKLNAVETSNYIGEDGTRTVKRYAQDSDYIYSYDYSDNNSVHTSVYQNASEYMANGVLDPMSSVKNDDDKKTVNKIVHFAELAADTFVGDLKNNIVYVSGDDNSSTYEMNLEAVQIPELVNAGLSAMFSSINSSTVYSDDSKDPFHILGTDPFVKSASLKFTVDNEGRFTNCLAVATMAGNGHEASVSAELTISDYGTTKPERVDISTLKDVEYFDYNDHKAVSTEEAEHVDEDGNVLNSDGEVVGSIEINGDGEGVIVYNTQQ